jgi:hypothetical protein
MEEREEGIEVPTSAYTSLSRNPTALASLLLQAHVGSDNLEEEAEERKEEEEDNKRGRKEQEEAGSRREKKPVSKSCRALPTSSYTSLSRNPTALARPCLR